VVHHAGMADDSGAAGPRSSAVAAAVATVAILPVMLTGALAVQVRAELGFDEGGLGLTVAAFFGAAAVASTFGGRVAERLGPRAAMRLAAVAAGAALAAVALVAHSLRLLLACLALGGLANALAQPATNLFLARRVLPSRLGLAFGVKQSAVPAATLLGGVSVPAVALTVGWRWAYAGAALVAVLLAVVDPGGAPGPPPPAGGARRGSRDTSLRPLVVLAAGIGLGAAAAGTLGSFLVSAAVDAGIAEGPAGLLAAGCSLAGIGTRLLVGARADRRGGRHLVAVTVMLTSGSVGYLLLASTVPALVAGGALIGYCLAWGWPGLFNLAVVRDNPGAPGAATGITQTGTYAGAVLGPLLFGMGAERWSYTAAWVAAAVTSLAAAAVVAGGRRLLRADRSRRAAAPSVVPPL
jgi:MFS family permease